MSTLTVSVQVAVDHLGVFLELVNRPAAVIDKLIQVRKVKVSRDILVVVDAEDTRGTSERIRTGKERVFAVKRDVLGYALVPPRIVNVDVLHLSHIDEQTIHQIVAHIGLVIDSVEIVGISHDGRRHIVDRLLTVVPIAVRRVAHILDLAVQTVCDIFARLPDSVVYDVSVLFLNVEIVDLIAADQYGYGLSAEIDVRELRFVGFGSDLRLGGAVGVV